MTKEQVKKPSFAVQFRELEKIVEGFENSAFDLDAALVQFERGLKLAEELKKTLEGVENKIHTLKSKYHAEEE